MPQTRLPNIVFFLADQCRRDALGAYGNEVIQTPNIDRVAQNGVRFDQFISPSPLCMPVRGSMITGRFPSCHGVKSNGVPLRLSEPTFTEELRRAGYHTAVIGKLHLVPMKNRRAYLPHPDYGFNTMLLAEGELNPTNLGHLDAGELVANCPDDYSQWLEKRSPEIYRRLLLEPYWYKPYVNPCPEELHQATWVADRSVEFLDRYVSDSRPFYLNVSFFDPHPSFDPPGEFSRMYDWRDMPAPVRADGEQENRPTHPSTRALLKALQESGISGEEWLRVRAAYYGLISLVDKQIGRVYKRLEELNLLENTLIVFCADHGEMAGDHDLVEKGPFHYDPTIRVPLVISWPGRLPYGQVVSELAQHVDLGPTFLDAADLAVPHGMQGVSLIPVAKGEAKGYDATLTEDFGLLSLWKGLRQMTLRTQRFRYTHQYNGPLGELYDLQEDPHELRNLYNDSSCGSTLTEMKHALIEKMIEVIDPLPRFETEY